MRQLALLVMMGFYLGLTACGFKELPKMKADADLALKQVVLEYRLRADIVPHIINLVKSRTDGQWPHVVSEIQMAHAHAVAMDMPIEQLNEVQMNRMASFQAALSHTVTSTMAALEKDPKVNKGELLSLKEQLDRAENRIAVARQKYRELAPAFNEKLNKTPEKWFNSLLYKLTPLLELQ